MRDKRNGRLQQGCAVNHFLGMFKEGFIYRARTLRFLVQRAVFGLGRALPPAFWRSRSRFSFSRSTSALAEIWSSRMEFSAACVSAARLARVTAICWSSARRRGCCGP